MDLIGMGRARRAQQVYTVVRRDASWTNGETMRLCTRLQPMTIVGSHPLHPTTIIIAGDYSREQIQSALVADTHSLELERVVGMDNPALPFAAPQL